VRVEWTGGRDVKNGAYGIYPVKTHDTLIENCVVIGASDAGIYGGPVEEHRHAAAIASSSTWPASKSRIRSTPTSTATRRPTTPAASWCSTCRTSPSPATAPACTATKVFKNNTGNLRRQGRGRGSVPAGSGVVINSNDKVEIFDNDISDNDTAT
jgi:hypothetical protein